MFCPNCGQEQVSKETKFCSRCGFLMVGVLGLIATGGNVPQFLPTDPKTVSPRKKGLKQGGVLFLLGIFLVPFLGVLTNILYFSTYFVGLAAIVFFLGGFLRMVYALIFESGNPADKTLEENVFQTAQKLLNKQPKQNELPPQQSIPVNSYIPPIQGNWRDTNDLSPTSVTDNTTKLLQKDQSNK